MADSIAVLPPGWRALDINGVPLTDAVISFFDAGTSNPRIVYSDLGLTVALGTSVTCNSAGVPVSSGNVQTLIYTGNAPYKVRISSAILGGTVFEYDFVKGAFDSSVFLTAAFTPGIPVIAQSSDRAILAADKGKLINCNPTALALTMSLAPATTLGDGFCVGFRHEGDANWVNIIAGNGTDLISYAGGYSTAITLTGRGHTIWIVCDGVGFKVYGEVPALISNDVGVISIVDRVATLPVGAAVGSRYIITAAVGGFAIHDIVEFSFTGWFKYTPPANYGWVAYVRSEVQLYCFRGTAWTQGADAHATNTTFGLLTLATKTELEAAVSVSAAVVPGRQNLHPGMPKFVAAIVWAAGVPVLQAVNSYGVTSLVDNGTGDVTVNLSVTFANALWGCMTSTSLSGGTANPSAVTTTSVRILTFNNAGVAADPSLLCVTGYGLLA